MSTPRLLLFAVSAFALASCNPFHHESSVQVSAKHVNLNSRCGSDDGIVGSAGAYPIAKVGRDGHATSLANLTLDTPTVGSYFVSVSASAANDAVSVACGNLAPPTL